MDHMQEALNKHIWNLGNINPREYEPINIMNCCDVEHYSEDPFEGMEEHSEEPDVYYCPYCGTTVVYDEDTRTFNKINI